MGIPTALSASSIRVKIRDSVGVRDRVRVGVRVRVRGLEG